MRELVKVIREVCFILQRAKIVILKICLQREPQPHASGLRNKNYGYPWRLRHRAMSLHFPHALSEKTNNTILDYCRIPPALINSLSQWPAICGPPPADYAFSRLP
jgi:hypothetical protein